MSGMFCAVQGTTPPCAAKAVIPLPILLPYKHLLKGWGLFWLGWRDGAADAAPLIGSIHSPISRAKKVPQALFRNALVPLWVRIPFIQIK